MSEIASAGQLRMSFLRIALVVVPMVLLLGLISGFAGGSSGSGPWFEALAKPPQMPAPATFPIVWTILYVMIGFALTMIVAARRAAGRTMAIALFAIQFALNLAWSPLFFAGHQIGVAFAVILLMIVFTIATILAFARIRSRAAALMVPYLAWICFAAWLTHSIDVLNPGAASLAPAGHSAQIDL